MIYIKEFIQSLKNIKYLIVYIAKFFLFLLPLSFIYK